MEDRTDSSYLSLAQSVLLFRLDPQGAPCSRLGPGMPAREACAQWWQLRACVVVFSHAGGSSVTSFLSLLFAHR